MDVYQLLVTQGNLGLLPANGNVTGLAPGQLGVFNGDTNLSIDAASTGVRSLYLAVGIDTDGDGVTDDAIKSRGTKISKENIKYVTYRPHTPGRPMKVVLKDYTADCDTEYGIKLQLSSQVILRTQGTVPFSKMYMMKTSCCDGCEPTCPSGDANEITKQLFLLINSEKEGMVKANILPRGSVAAAGVAPVNGYLTVANLDTIMAYNAIQPTTATYVYTNLEIETVTAKIYSYASINLNYFFPRGVFVNVAKIEGFKCTGTVLTTQEQVFEEGSGYDVKQIEYKTMGWNVSPYRVSDLLGVGFERSYMTNVNEKYDLFHLAYTEVSKGGFLTYFNPEATTIAIPATSTVTRDALATILNAHLTTESFESLVDDAASANVNPLTIERTTDKTKATDGISE